MKADELETLKERLEPFFQGKSVRKAVLFGSAARDRETRRSDLDLMIVYDTDKRFFDRYEEFEGIYELLPGHAIDMLIYTPQELERISHRKFIQTIHTQGKVLYEH